MCRINSELKTVVTEDAPLSYLQHSEMVIDLWKQHLFVLPVQYAKTLPPEFQLFMQLPPKKQEKAC